MVTPAKSPRNSPAGEIGVSVQIARLVSIGGIPFETHCPRSLGVEQAFNNLFQSVISSLRSPLDSPFEFALSFALRMAQLISEVLASERRNRD